MSDAEKDVDWSKTTFEGSRREQLRRWRSLTVRQRLEALDALTDVAEKMRNRLGSTRREVREGEAPYEGRNKKQ